MATTRIEATERPGWPQFKQRRDGLSFATACSFLTSMTAIFFLITTGDGPASMPGGTGVLVPSLVVTGVMTLACAGWGVGMSLFQSGALARWRELAARASFVIIITMLVGFVVLVVVEPLAHGLHVILMIFVAIVSFSCLCIVASDSFPALAKSVSAPFNEEAMGVKTLLGRTLRYCGKHYWQLLVLFVLFQVFARLARFGVMIPWAAVLEGEEVFLVSYLRDMNFTPGMSIDPAIVERARALYIWQQVHFVVNDAFSSWFYFFATGTGIQLVVRSYRGNDPSPVHPFTRDARLLGKLAVLAALFSLAYHALLLVVVVPGVIFYVYCIMVFPNLLVVRKYRLVENFGKAKDLIKNSFVRVAGYVILLLVLKFLVNIPASLLTGAVHDAAGGVAVTKAWLLDPLANAGGLLGLDLLDGILGSFIGPLEAALAGILFIDLQARQKGAKEKAKDESTKGRVEALKGLPLEERTKRARYCETCGLSLRASATRCPNCKTRVEQGAA